MIALPKDSERTEVVASQWIVLALPNGRFSEENILDPRLTHRPSVSSTNGLLPTCLAQRDPVEEKLVDTNGAGDAFVGGFLAALAKGKDMEVRPDRAVRASRAARVRESFPLRCWSAWR